MTVLISLIAGKTTTPHLTSTSTNIFNEFES